MKLPVYTAGEGETILMIHGIISDGSFFSEVIDFLASDYHVIAYDRRGYGVSACGNIDDYSVAAQARDAAEILWEQVDGPAWIFGNSAGGLIALEMCLRFPKLVKGMILLEPSLVFDEESAGLIAEWNQELNSYAQEKRIKKALLAFSRIIGKQNVSGAETSLEEMKHIYKNLENFMYGELNEVQNYRPSREVVEKIAVPVRILITTEGRDSIFSRTSQAGAQTLHWPVSYVPGYHNVVKDNPELSARYIKRILKEMKSIEGEKYKI